MLRVRDSKTGKVADVRAMLGINNNTIKNDELRQTVSQYSLSD